MSKKPKTIDATRRYLQSEAARLQQTSEVAALVMSTHIALRTLIDVGGLQPMALLAVCAAIVEHLRRDAHEWIADAEDYPHDDAFHQELITLGVHDALDIAEDVGLVLADLLRDVAPGKAEVVDGHLVITDEAGRFVHSFEVLAQNAPGSRETN